MYETLALLAVFVLVYSAVAGAVERSWISGPIIFTLFGLMIGPLGFDLLSLQTDREMIKALAAIDEHSWNPPHAYPAEPVKAEDRVGYSPEIWAGRLNVDDVIKPIYEEAGKALGRTFEYPEN
jgi:hypothetical protein